MTPALAAVQAAFAAALLDPALPVPAGVTSAAGRADAVRFAVYRNNVAVGLAKALASNFPVVKRLVGEEFFAGVARSYITGTRPASPLIFAYGHDFADFIAGFQPAAGLPYLADVARLERAWLSAYHAADARPLGIAALAGLGEAMLAAARLVLHPTAAVVRSRFPVGSIWQAHQSDPVGGLTASGAESVLIVRPGFEVDVHILPAEDAAFAEALLCNTTIGEAAAQAARADPRFDFGRALVGLVSLGAFSDITLSNGVLEP